MGCDIHAYLEASCTPDSPSWRCIADLHLPRDYAMFTEMADVRNDTETPSARPAKGMPEGKISYWVDMEFFSVTILKDEDFDETREASCSVQSAQEYVNGWGSTLRRPDDGIVPGNAISNPDWHSASWLSTNEYAAALHDCGLKNPHAVNPGYFAVLAMMEYYERVGCSARLVFWFDN